MREREREREGGEREREREKERSPTLASSISAFITQWTICATVSVI